MNLKKALKEAFIEEQENQKESPFDSFTIELKKLYKAEPGKPEGWRARIVDSKLEPELQKSQKPGSYSSTSGLGLAIGSHTSPADALVELSKKLEKIQHKMSGEEKIKGIKFPAQVSGQRANTTKVIK